MNQAVRNHWAGLGYPVTNKFFYKDSARQAKIIRASQGIDCLTMPAGDGKNVWYGFKTEDDLKLLRERLRF